MTNFAGCCHSAGPLSGLRRAYVPLARGVQEGLSAAGPTQSFPRRNETEIRNTMKTIPTLVFTVGVFASSAIVCAQTTTTEETVVREKADGRTETTTTTTTHFTPEARTKVVKYFDSYKESPHGLPPAWASRVKVEELPETWRTSAIAPGVVITEKERPYLVEAPSDLVSLLPAGSGVRYYVAGGNVVAIDDGYRVVESVRIPSIRFTVE